MLAKFIGDYGDILLKGCIDTIFMSSTATIFSYIFGTMAGCLLFVTAKGSICEAVKFNSVFGWLINTLRSIPFIILIVTLLPFTRAVAGTAIGPMPTIIPLVVGCFPFVARMIEAALAEVDISVIEAAKCMGATNFQIVVRVLLKESFPTIVRGIPICAITLIGYSAIAGAVGAGGLGDIAVRYGYHRRETTVMWVTTALLVVIVSLIQLAFSSLARRIDKKI